MNEQLHRRVRKQLDDRLPYRVAPEQIDAALHRAASSFIPLPRTATRFDRRLHRRRLVRLAVASIITRTIRGT